MNEHIYQSAIDKLEFSEDLNIKTLKYLDYHKSIKQNTKETSRKSFYIGLTTIVAVFLLAIGVSILDNNTNHIAQNDSNLRVDTSSLYPGYTLEDLVIFSDIIAVGEVKAISNSIEIKPAGGGDTDFFTDYIVELKETYKDVSERTNSTSKSVPLRIRTGKPEMAVSNDIDFDFKIGDRYLFFLSYPTSGGGYTVNDNHISLVGGSQGLLEIKSENKFYNYYHNTIDTDELLSIINDPDIQKSAEEFDPLYGLKENLKNGFITQKEYDRAIKDLSEYAEIVND